VTNEVFKFWRHSYFECYLVEPKRSLLLFDVRILEFDNNRGVHDGEDAASLGESVHGLWIQMSKF